MNITKLARSNALRMACVVLASTSIGMMAQAAQIAGSDDTPPQKVVSFKDLNLNNPEGAAVLYRRINSAAHEVCENPYRYDLSPLKARSCIQEAVSRAVADVNNPLLTSLYNSKTGKVDKHETTLAQAR